MVGFIIIDVEHSNNENKVTFHNQTNYNAKVGVRFYQTSKVTFNLSPATQSWAIIYVPAKRTEVLTSHNTQRLQIAIYINSDIYITPLLPAYITG